MFFSRGGGRRHGLCRPPRTPFPANCSLQQHQAAANGNAPVRFTRRSTNTRETKRYNVFKCLKGLVFYCFPHLIFSSECFFCFFFRFFWLQLFGRVVVETSPLKQNFTATRSRRRRLHAGRPPLPIKVSRGSFARGVYTGRENHTYPGFLTQKIEEEDWGVTFRGNRCGIHAQASKSHGQRALSRGGGFTRVHPPLLAHKASWFCSVISARNRIFRLIKD